MKLTTTIREYDPEQRKVLEFIRAAHSTSKGVRVLDVGCGYGRNLRPLKAAGFDVLGVDANPEIVKHNVRELLPCVSVEELASGGRRFDVILMSHIVEHFEPSALLAFIDSHLDRLESGGRLVVCTPLYNPWFYDDFDHVRPYHPAGILMVFGKSNSQVQWSSRNKLRLEDLWFRRGPLRFAHNRSQYLATPWTRLISLVELTAAAAFFLTRGWIGRKDGWVGTFRKLPA